MPLNKVNLLSPLVNNSSSVTPENLQRWAYNNVDVAAITPTGMLDLRYTTTGSLVSGGLNGNLGTKIVFYSNDLINPSYGFGLQGGRLVGLVDAGGAFSLRTSIGGSDVVRLNNDGNISGRYVDSLANSGSYLDMGVGSSGILVMNRSTGHVPIAIRAVASQSSSLTEWQNSAGTVLAKINQVGSAVFGNATLSAIGNLNAFSSDTAAIPLVVQSIAGQTADLQQWQNSTSTVLLGLNNNASFYRPGNTGNLGFGMQSAAEVPVGAKFQVFGDNFTTSTQRGGAEFIFSSLNSGTGGFTIFQYDGSYAARFKVFNGGSTSVNSTSSTLGAAGTVAHQLGVVSGAATTVGMVIRGAGSQSANLQEWQTSAPATVASVSSTGAFQATTAIFTGSTLAINGATPAISSTNASAASIFTSTVTGVTVGSSTIKTTAYPIAPVGTTSGTVTQSAQLSGYIGLPQNAYVAAGIWAYSFGSLDAGKHIYVTGTPTSATITIPANSAVAFEIGTTIVIMNDLGAATNISIAITTDTLQLAGTGSTGTRTLARYGVASVTKVTSTKWIISGNGLT